MVAQPPWHTCTAAVGAALHVPRQQLHLGHWPSHRSSIASSRAQHVTRLSGGSSSSCSEQRLRLAASSVCIVQGLQLSQRRFPGRAPVRASTSTSGRPAITRHRRRCGEGA